MLDSVAAQSFADVELIVQDGGSTDGTCDLLASRSAEITHWDSSPDGGIYAAWNKALAHATGDWICFLGSDDSFHDADALRDVMAAAARLRREIRVVYAKVALITRSGRTAQIIGEPWARARPSFLAGFMIPHPGALHRRSLFDTHGNFDPSYRIAGDYEMLLRELRDGEAGYVDRIVVDMRLGGASARPTSIRRALLEVARARAAHGLRGVPLRLRIALLTSRIGAAVYRLLGERTFIAIADAYRVLRGKPRIWAD
jgi:glycosyltransferase involved in cell wall biosynthesis